MHFKTLDEWLSWQIAVHPREIELGLTRCRTIAQRLDLLPSPFPLINVAGTNGKGSSVALLDVILSAAGLRTGRYTSPHLLRYNERICIAGQEANDAQLCEAYEMIETVRGDISLTFFEFGTLAAMLVFRQNKVDLAVLEVGLGGRLDAVNVFDPIISLVTAIGIDHTDWLGPDRESIGFEKAGIFRAQCPAVCSDAHPPQSLINHAHQLSTPLYCLGRDFIYTKAIDDNSWSWQSHTKTYPHLPLPALPGDFQLQNAAGVLMVLELLNYPLPEAILHQGLANVRLPGRFQLFPGKVTRIFDVAHNPMAAQALNTLLQQPHGQGKTHAVVSILKDKDILGIVAILQENITSWHVAPLNTPRSATVQCLVDNLQAVGTTNIHTYTSVADAYTQALSQAQEGDRIIVFGSFYTVAEALQIEIHKK
jgi:dihydrofolate synthase/folylpolyglutamate synthase